MQEPHCHIPHAHLLKIFLFLKIYIYLVSTLEMKCSGVGGVGVEGDRKSSCSVRSVKSGEWRDDDDEIRNELSV